MCIAKKKWANVAGKNVGRETISFIISQLIQPAHHDLHDQVLSSLDEKSHLFQSKHRQAQLVGLCPEQTDKILVSNTSRNFSGLCQLSHTLLLSSLG